MIARDERLADPELIGDRAIAWRDYCLRTHDAGRPILAGRPTEWLDVRRDFGAVGDGQADDTAAIQSGLDALGTGPARVLYVPAGIYRVRKTLHLAERSAVAVLGAAPGLCTVAYDGPAGQPILRCSDARCVRIGHLAWDGRRQASAAVDHVWSRPALSAWIEHVDEEFDGTVRELAGGRILQLPGRCALVPWR